MNSDNIRRGARCMYAREVCCMRRELAARLLLMKPSRLKGIEKGIEPLTDEVAEMMAALYSITVEWFYEGEEFWRGPTESYLSNYETAKRNRMKRLIAIIEGRCDDGRVLNSDNVHVCPNIWKGHDCGDPF